MGYNTEFTGSIKVFPAVKLDLILFINKLARTRRVKRSVNILNNKFSSTYGFNGRFGVEGEFFVGVDQESIVDFNKPPITQPGLWMQWEISSDGKEIIWNGNEKFYNADEWMIYLIDKILKPEGYICNGTITAQGEIGSDKWLLKVQDNRVSIHTDTLSNNASSFIDGDSDTFSKNTKSDSINNLIKLYLDTLKQNMDKSIKISNVVEFLESIQSKL